jgi:hypothetical protein
MANPTPSWISWTDQQETTGTPFPGMAPQLDVEIVGPVVQDYLTLGTLGTYSLPTYANVPTTVNAVDPWAGWTAQSTTREPSVTGETGF